MRTKNVMLVLLILLFVSVSVWSGTTGKIAGSVRDADTGEPLIGANVVLQGTYLGASTDMDGYFYIINVPVGEYTIEVSMIGYQSVIYPGVKVVLDQTTKLEFELKEQAVAGEAVIVTAERDLEVEKDVTTKKVLIDRKEITHLPVRDFSDLVEAQAGVIRIEGSLKGIPGFEDRGIEEVHVRGGRSSEIAYLIDGMYTENPIYGGRYTGIQLNKYASEQVDMKTGVFDAEYGDAMSSVVNVVTRSGSDQFEGNLNIETSAFGFKPDRLRDYQRISGAFGGPIVGNDLTFMLSGEFTDRSYAVYEFDDITFNASDTLANRWGPGDMVRNAMEFEGLDPTDPDDYDTYYNRHLQPAHRYDRFSGWQEYGFNKDFDLFGKLTWRISQTMKLDLTGWGVANFFKTMNTSNHWYRFYEEGRNVVRQRADRQSLVFTHTLSKSTFYILRGSRFFQRMRIGVPRDGSYIPSAGDIMNYALGFESNESEDWLEPDEYRSPDGPPSENWRQNNTNKFEWNDATNQWRMTNQTVEDGRNFYFDPVLDQWVPEDWYDWDASLWEFYAEGHDRYYHHSFAETWDASLDLVSQVTKHHQIKTGLQFKQHNLYFDEIQLPWLLVPYTEGYDKEPIEAAFYLQDKIEYDYMTINIGMRVDMNNPRSTFWDNPTNPRSDERVLSESENKYNVSPRVGFSHVITENSTFTFGYGQFYQFPTYRNIYLNSERDLLTPLPILGNAHMQSQKVTQYEFGLNTELTRGFIFQLIGWSKEYSNLNSTQRVPSWPRTYYVNLNTDYATARGVDVNVRFRKSRVNGMLQYTYSRATANNKDPWESYRAQYTEQTQPRREFLMGYDRTHDMTLSGTYAFPENSGFSLLGVKPFSNSRFDVIFSATSGAPYTPTHNNIAGPTNSEREPWYITTNIHFRKNFELYGLNYIFGILVFNALDRENPLDVYTETGQADNPGKYINNLIERNIYTRTLWDQPFRYGPRRRVDFTLEVSF